MSALVRFTVRETLSYRCARARPGRCAPARPGAAPSGVGPLGAAPPTPSAPPSASKTSPLYKFLFFSEPSLPPWQSRSSLPCSCYVFVTSALWNDIFVCISPSSTQELLRSRDRVPALQLRSFPGLGNNTKCSKYLINDGLTKGTI